MGAWLGGDRSISRQQRWQLRQKKKGRCHICNKKRKVGSYCLAHAIYVRERQRKIQGSKRRNNSKTYQLEKKLK